MLHAGKKVICTFSLSKISLSSSDFQAAVRPGLGVAQSAVIMKNLMNRLGFKKYYVQGGDWGAAIVSTMAKFYPDEILGHHSNALMVLVIFFLYYKVEVKVKIYLLLW